MFYEFNQNNSGGSYIQNDNVDRLVIIEANSVDEACERAESIGIYFDGCRDGSDCSCCGDRWDAPFSEKYATKRPSYYSTPLEDATGFYEPVTAIVHYLDGRKVRVVLPPQCCKCKKDKATADDRLCDACRDSVHTKATLCITEMLFYCDQIQQQYSGAIDVSMFIPAFEKQAQDVVARFQPPEEQEFVVDTAENMVVHLIGLADKFAKEERYWKHENEKLFGDEIYTLLSGLKEMLADFEFRRVGHPAGKFYKKA